MSALARWRRFARDGRGASAVEFSIALPVLITLFFGGFATAQAIALARKVTITTRALADLTTQVGVLTSSDLGAIMNASRQVIAPFDVTPLGIRISEVTAQGLNSKGVAKKAKVVWSCSTDADHAAYDTTDKVALPTGLAGLTNQTFIYAETFYSYDPGVGSSVVGAIQLGDNIFMVPRVSTTVNLSGSCPS